MSVSFMFLQSLAIPRRRLVCYPMPYFSSRYFCEASRLRCLVFRPRFRLPHGFSVVR